MAYGNSFPSAARTPQIYGGRVLPWTYGFVTEFWDGLTGITVTGQGVSAWAPIKGTHSFTQGSDAARPTYASGVLTFDGVGQSLTTGAFTLSQPWSFAIVFKWVTWASNLYVFDGNSGNTGALRGGASGTQPATCIRAGAVLSLTPASLVIDQYAVVVGVFNGASSVIQAGLVETVTGDAGAGNAGGLKLGSDGGGASFSNVSINAYGYGVGAWSAAQRAQIVRSCQQRYPGA